MSELKFDPYDVVAIIIPGIIVVLTVSNIFPGIVPGLDGAVTVGDLGITLILSFIAGHLLQAIGNFIEKLIWFPLGGMPTRWASREETQLLSQKQLADLEQKLSKDFGWRRTDLRNGPAEIRQVYSFVQKHGKIDRIKKFNQNYGLMRGIVAGFALSAIFVLVFKCELWPYTLMLIAGAGFAVYRMVRFGVHYARELYIEYLLATSTKNDEDKPPHSSKT